MSLNHDIGFACEWLQHSFGDMCFGFLCNYIFGYAIIKNRKLVQAPWNGLRTDELIQKEFRDILDVNEVKVNEIKEITTSSRIENQGNFNVFGNDKLDFDMME